MFPYSFSFFKNIIFILCVNQNLRIFHHCLEIFNSKHNNATSLLLNQFLSLFSFSHLHTQKYVIETSRSEKRKKKSRIKIYEEGAVWSPTITQLLPSFPSRDREKAGDNNFSRYLSKLLVPRRRARKEIPITFDTIESRVHTRAHTRVGGLDP